MNTSHRSSSGPTISRRPLWRLALVLATLTLGEGGSCAESQPPVSSSESKPATSEITGFPVVRVTTVSDGQYVNGMVRVVAEVTHSIPPERVSLLVGEEVRETRFKPPYAFDWDTRREGDGPTIVSVTAIDPEFREGRVRLAVTVDNVPPTVRLIAPMNGLMAVGTIRLAAEASDVLGIKIVRFLANGEPVGEIATPPYTCEWDTTRVPNTRYAVQARAFDRADNSTTTSSVTIRVANLNQHPALNPIGPKSVREGDTLTFTVQATDPDGPRDPVTYEAFHLPPWGHFDPATRTFTGTPGPQEASPKKPQKIYGDVRFQACDPEPLCTGENIAITVLDRNQAPIVKSPGNKSIQEGETLVFRVTATDPDGDELTCKAEHLPSWATFLASTCTFRGTPGLDIASLHEPKVTFSDVQFEFCDKEPLCTKEAISLDVINVNTLLVWQEPPVVTGEEARRIEFQVGATGPEHHKLELTAKTLPDGAQFADLGFSVGRFLWTPRPDQSGRHTVMLSATDGNLSEDLTVMVTVRETILAISGTIRDERKKPVPDIPLLLTLGPNVVGQVTTDEHGRYLFRDIRPGEYFVRPNYKARWEFTTKAKKLKSAAFVPALQRVMVSTGDQRHVDFSVELPQ